MFVLSDLVQLGLFHLFMFYGYIKHLEVIDALMLTMASWQDVCHF